VTFVDWEDVARWQMIDRALKLPFKDPIETYSTSDHVYTGLNIPAGTGGTLPKASRTREGLGAEKVEDLGETGKKKRPDHDDRQRHDGHKHDGHKKTEHKHADRKPAEHKPREKKHEDKAPAVARTEASPETKSAASTEASSDKARRNRQRRRTRGGEAVTPE
jgi:hypothetical protein